MFGRAVCSPRSGRPFGASMTPAPLEAVGPRGRRCLQWPSLALALLAVLFCQSLGHPRDFPRQPSGRVTDLAGVLAPEERDELSGRLAAFERETTHQVAILILPSLEGEPLEPFAHRVATAWKLGRAGVDNGILLLVSVQDRKLRIEVGYGLEAVLPDGRAGAIIREAIVPRFRQGQYARGLHAALDEIFSATRGEAGKVRAVLRHLRIRLSWGEVLAMLTLLGFALVGLAHFVTRRFLGEPFWAALVLSPLLLVAGLWGAGGQDLPWGYILGFLGEGMLLLYANVLVEQRHRCPRCGGWLARSVSREGDQLEIVRTDCLACHSQGRTVMSVPLQTSSDSTSDSGFWLGSGSSASRDDTGGRDTGSGFDFSGGGGDFGGGGASGSW